MQILLVTLAARVARQQNFKIFEKISKIYFCEIRKNGPTKFAYFIGIPREKISARSEKNCARSRVLSGKGYHIEISTFSAAKAAILHRFQPNLVERCRHMPSTF